MNKKVFIGIIIVLAFIGIMLWGRPKQTALSGQNQVPLVPSTLTASELLYDFGVISMAKGNVSRAFTVTNASSEDVLVESVTTSCMCTAAYVVNGESRKGPFGMPGMGIVPKANERIKAGESRTIDVVYNPAAHGPAGVGPIDRFVYLKDSKGGILKLEIKALVTP